eukprot:TRINITY_DN4640_c1_g1_i2.p2 TRINITY_DN4640_c1_g1~~TRINITY_DN4640_c1_g1_i2.p2  ORF type:complete len:1291 (+),score=520.77 TRINITY_DN4640_c1_g1_i2:132-4004(+)
MTTPQKPENALRRAEDFLQVGKKSESLNTLHAAITNRKFRNQFSPILEEIMMKLLELCVELKRMRTAREALHQYRTTCQNNHIKSIETVITHFRQKAEAKVQQAKAEQEDAMAAMEDFDEAEAPQTILLRAIQASDTRQQSQDRDVHMHFRFLWDTYKVCLDVLKNNHKLEEVYHQTASNAFEFCRANSRPSEFKRLCETLRKNYQDSLKRQAPSAAGQVNAADAGLGKNLETRFRQVQVAIELDLWREAYVTATEIYELMNKMRPKPVGRRSKYYEYLAQIFWKSENYLFHAFACLKNLMFEKASNKQNAASPEDLQYLASKAVLAAVCVPLVRNTDFTASLELSAESGSSPYEKAKKHATLFNVQAVPTRETIITQLQEKGLLALASEPCQRLFALVESDFTPLSLCQDAKPFLDEVATDKVCDGKLNAYVTPLKQIIFFRLMKQLSEVYSNITIQNFEKAATIVPFSVAEKWMANAARQQGINIQINYSQKAIVFGSSRKVDMTAMRQPLIELGHKLQQAMQKIAPEEQHKKEKLEKQQLSVNLARRVEEETQRIRLRKEEIERRKEADEKRRELAEREEMERERRKEAKEAEQERQRQVEERKKRELDREEQKKKDARIAKNKEMLEQMKKQADARSVNLKVGGKKITEIEADDLENIAFEQIEKARESQVQRERQEKIRQRKLESKRIDHLARAMREESQDLMDKWAQKIQDQDDIFLEGEEAKRADQQREAHEEGLKEKAALAIFQPARESWMKEQLGEREAEWEEACMARERRCLTKVVEGKIERAKKRREEHEAKNAKELAEKRKKEEAERKQREDEEEAAREAEDRRVREEQEEEERREREEREAAQKAEREEKRREMERMANAAEEKRRAREAEIEKRREEEKEADRAKRQQDRDQDRRPAAAPKEEEGGWRRGPPAAGARGADDGPRRGGRDEPPRRDEPRGGGGGAWRSEREERPAPSRGGDDRGPPRRGGDEREERGSAWGRGPPAADRAAPRRDAREEPEEKPSRQEPERPKAEARRAEPEKEESKGGGDEDDEGWDTVASNKKKGKKKQEEAPKDEPTPTSAGRPSPPWKKNKDDDAGPPRRTEGPRGDGPRGSDGPRGGGDRDRDGPRGGDRDRDDRGDDRGGAWRGGGGGDRPSRDDWKSKGKEDDNRGPPRRFDDRDDNRGGGGGGRFGGDDRRDDNRGGGGASRFGGDDRDRRGFGGGGGDRDRRGGFGDDRRGDDRRGGGGFGDRDRRDGDRDRPAGGGGGAGAWRRDGGGDRDRRGAGGGGGADSGSWR